jgi:hypothetical protein
MRRASRARRRRLVELGGGGGDEVFEKVRARLASAMCPLRERHGSVRLACTKGRASKQQINGWMDGMRELKSLLELQTLRSYLLSVRMHSNIQTRPLPPLPMLIGQLHFPSPYPPLHTYPYRPINVIESGRSADASTRVAAILSRARETGEAGVCLQTAY